jgi:hypothetical protein
MRKRWWVAVVVGGLLLASGALAQDAKKKKKAAKGKQPVEQVERAAPEAAPEELPAIKRMREGEQAKYTRRSEKIAKLEQLANSALPDIKSRVAQLKIDEAKRHEAALSRITRLAADRAARIKNGDARTNRALQGKLGAQAIGRDRLRTPLSPRRAGGGGTP